MTPASRLRELVVPARTARAIGIRLCLAALLIPLVVDAILRLPDQSILLFLLISLFNVGCVGLAAIGLLAAAGAAGGADDR